ncbi:MAG: hypothetical protein ACXVAX_13635 [Pseudobdellovibrio sp.]
MTKLLNEIILNKVNRRDFLYSGAVAASGLVLSSCVTRMPYTNVYGGSAVKASNAVKGNAIFGYVNQESKKSTLRVMNWDDLTFRDYILPLFKNPHYVSRNLANPNEVFIVELLGSLMKLNLETNEYLMVGRNETQHLFLGHFAQTSDGERLYCVEGIPGASTNLLVVRSAKTLELIEVVADYFHMHHIIRVPNSTLVAYQAQRSVDSTAGVYIYDYDKKEQVRFIETDFNFPSHLSMMSPTEIIAPTYNTGPKDPELSGAMVSDGKRKKLKLAVAGPSPLYHMSLDGSKFSFWDESQKELEKGGMSAVYLPTSKRVISTFVGSDTVAVWKDYKLEKTISTHTPFSILASHDESEFMVFSTHKGNIKIYSSDTFQELRTIDFADSRICFLSGYA